MNQTDYTALITSQHRKPKFTAMVGVNVVPLVGAINALNGLPAKFDLDTAEGIFLKILAQLVGAPTVLKEAVPQPFFGFSDQEASLGFSEIVQPEQGGFFREWDEQSTVDGLIPDELLRKVIRAKILKNRFAGTKNEIRAILELVLPDPVYVIDGFDMTMIVNFQHALSAFELALVEALIPRPAGVNILSDKNWAQGFSFADQPLGSGFSETNEASIGGFFIERVSL